MNSIEGTWLSRYEYTQGSNSEPSVSEHDIEFKSADSGWIGKSLPQPDSFEITIELTQKGTEFSGTWQERTALDGHYKGREFSGLLMLILNSANSELSGMWLGASSSTGHVKAGRWTLQKISD
jgi:hypothetical protein